MISTSFFKPLCLMSIFSALAVNCSSPTTTTETTQDQLAMEQAATDNLLFIGTYTQKEGHVDGKAEGVYMYNFNSETGALTRLSTSPAITNPSYITVHPSGQWLFAVSETGGPGEKDFGSVAAFRINQDNQQLEAINTVSSQGKYPCYISIDASGKNAMVANYGGGIAVLPIGEKGALQEATSVVQHSGTGPTPRQEAPHAHMITPGPGKFIYAVDLGTDKVYPYTLDANTGKLQAAGEPTAIEPGAGPRHLSFHPSKSWAYVVNELNGTIDAFKVNPANGALERFQTISTLPAGTKDAAACADIHVHPSGKFLYTSNRGSVNNIAMYGINETTGELQLLGHQSSKGQTPRAFVIDASGRFLLVANQDSSNVVSFRIDETSGKLQEIGNTQIPTPVSLKFLQGGKH